MEKAESQLDIRIPDLSGKNALVTGSTSGIGMEVAKSLGRMGANVYVHGRNKEKGEKIMEDISSNVGVESEFIQADFSNLNQVRGIPKQIDEDKIHYLVNNAGGYFVDDMKAMGIEYTFAVNHISPFVLTRNLLPKMESTDYARIVNVASEAHKAIDEFGFDAIYTEKNNWESYCRSKASNIMFTKELQEILPSNTDCCSVHPGTIPGSGFMRNRIGSVSKVLKIANHIPLPNVSTTAEGASRVLHSMFVEDCSGEYYVDKTPEPASKIVMNTDNRKKLWDVSEEIAGIQNYR